MIPPLNSPLWGAGGAGPGASEGPSLVDQALDTLDHLPPWVVARGLRPTRRNRYPWSQAETAELRAGWGKLSRAELSRRLTEILRRETGDPEAIRTPAALANYAYEIGLPAYNGEPGEIHLKAAADAVGVAYEILFNACTLGFLPSTRRGKQRYISQLDLANWYIDYCEAQLTQSEILEALELDDTIGKRDAMALTGYSETHFHRFLVSGLIRAWKIPDLGPANTGRGEWAIDLESLLDFLKIRAEGRLQELLDANPDYVEGRQQRNLQIKALRREGRLAQPDPLTNPKSRYLPGCFTVAQVASHVGLSCQSVYSNIQHGYLTARSIVAGGRARYAIDPAEARRYAQWLKTEPNKTGEWYTGLRQQIAVAGLLTTDDLATRFGVKVATITRWVKYGRKGIRLKSQLFGRYHVFHPEEVAAFEAAVQKAQSQPDDLTAAEVARRLNVNPYTVKKWATYGRAGRLLKSRREGRRRLFTLADVEQFISDTERKKL